MIENSRFKFLAENIRGTVIDYTLLPQIYFEFVKRGCPY